MSTISNLKPSRNVRTRSYRSAGRVWQLWKDLPGKWSIMYWNRSGECREVAVLTTGWRWVQAEGSGRLVRRRYWTLKDENGNKLGEYKSHLEGFKRFTAGL